MIPFKRTYEVCRLGIQTQMGRSPLLYRLAHRARGAARSRNLVGAATDLCIEAPSGSGNSFFVNGFLMANPGVRLAHHHHVAAQVKRSVALDLPTLVILRNPIDCVASRSRSAPWMVGPVFSQWIQFFRAAHALRASILMLPFETIIDDPVGAIERLNSRFACSFETAFPESERVFARMDAGYTRALPGSDRNPNRPHEGKLQALRRSRELAWSHPLAGTAIALYDQLQSSARG